MIIMNINNMPADIRIYYTHLVQRSEKNSEFNRKTIAW